MPAVSASPLRPRITGRPWFGVWALVLALAWPGAPAWAQVRLPAAEGATSVPPTTLHLIRVHQVWRDELPEQIDPAELEVVVLSPDNRCRPPPLKGLFGLTANALHPVTGAFCRRIEAFVKAPPEPLPLPVRVYTAPIAARQPAAVLAAIEPAPTRRYVALVHWDWAHAGSNNDWLFEVVLVERGSGRWLWHGARSHWVSPQGAALQDQTEVRALRALLQYELPRDLLNRSWWRDEVPMPGSRWVPVADIEGYRPAPDRAGLVIVNSYFSSTPSQDARYVKLWPAGTAEIDDTERLRQGDWSQSSTVRRAQATPLLAPGTYALLDLPAGDYAVSVAKDVERLALAPGRLAVWSIGRGMFNATTRSDETEAWWREKILGGRGRHGFLAEPPGRGTPPVVPFFLDGPP